ncbi:MAG: bifunctional phosphopantothenoylcysteine decarboxylase/phosphopantothenate--cysteine ligase CoaBC [Lachnospiraceae bacterium]|nr:bifunctional phosphopantothenoylcysteine decarboxylase/phosphopantothenate--cysteine ligase CoaBC [Lachnospiraceae bacterium]
MLRGKKNVLLVVTGSIAAYKAADIARTLVKAGLSVTTCLTKNGAEFITPLTLERLTASKCLTDTFDRVFQYEVEHISAAKAADLCVIAPATANIIGKIASGIADDMATTSIMACTCPKIIAPAMNTAMYDNPIMQMNMEKLRELGYHFIDPAEGLLACGDVGRGKLAPVDEICSYILNMLGETKKQDLAGRRVLVTAGPTQEAIDPVRYITNHSSGKMGYAIAQAARDRGAEVVLVSGQVALAPPDGVRMVSVVSARDMAEAVFAEFENVDVLVMAAAVADYRPVEIADQKIKKKDGDMVIRLARTTDIIGTIAGRKREDQFICGFSMETENLIENSRKKLEKKRLDMIAANSISEKGAGFAHDTNKITIITRDAEIPLPLVSKYETADLLWDAITSAREDGNKSTL